MKSIGCERKNCDCYIVKLFRLYIYEAYLEYIEVRIALADKLTLFAPPYTFSKKRNT